MTPNGAQSSPSQELRNLLTQLSTQPQEGVGVSIGVLGTALLRVLELLEGSSLREMEEITDYINLLSKIKTEVEKSSGIFSSCIERLGEAREKIKGMGNLSDSFGSSGYLLMIHEALNLQIESLSTGVRFFDLLRSNNEIQSLISGLEDISQEGEISLKQERVRKLSKISSEISELRKSIEILIRSISVFLQEINTAVKNVENRVLSTKKSLTEPEDGSQDPFSLLFGSPSNEDAKKYSYVFHRDILTTSLFGDIFGRVLTANTQKEQETLMEDISSQTAFFGLLGEGKLIPNGVLDGTEIVFEALENLEPHLRKALRSFETKPEVSVFSLPRETKESPTHRTHMGTEISETALSGIKNLDIGKVGDEKVFEMSVEKFRGDEELCRIKKKAFLLIEKIFIAIQNNENISDIFEELLLVGNEFTACYDKKFGYKVKNTRSPGKKQETRYHYVLVRDKHDAITGVKEVDVSEPSPSIGKSIATVKAKVKNLVRRDELTGNIRKLFVGKDNSLENILILGPYGTGKTALIRELAYDPSVVTLIVQASELLSMWYGVAEQNLKKLFEQAQALHIKTGKQVFIMVDEFDQLMNLGSSSNGNQGETLQKEMQILLDGVTEYSGVHLVGLSNEPERIPAGIIRRMDTVVTERLSGAEKKELILSKFGIFGIGESLSGFLEATIQDIDYDTLETRVTLWYTFHRKNEKTSHSFANLSPVEKSKVFWEFISEVGTKIDEETLTDEKLDLENHPDTLQINGTEKELYRYILMSTPKILSSICQQAFDIALEKKEREIGEQEMKRINRRLGKVKTEAAKRKVLADANICIDFDIFYEAAKSIFANPTIIRQIQRNEEFYAYLKSIGFVALKSLQ